MSRHGPTLREREQGLALHALGLDVIEGPDQGASVTSPSERLSVGSAEGNDLVLRDPTVSRFHLGLVRVDDRIEVLDHGSTNGTRLEGGLVENGRLFVRPGSRLGLGRTWIAVRSGEPITVPLHPEERLGGLIGRSRPMRALMARIARVAATDAAVLLEGESGTGKEVVARAIHDLSPRAAAPFVTLDCASLAPGLFASELFGHEKGAFTGAEQAFAGALERAAGGTLFLDELGEIPADLQSALVGALERKRFRRVGGAADLPLDVRVVAATNRALQAEVNRGTFRLDLYYRVAVVDLRLPPLRDRPEDVPLLVGHFARELGAEERLEEILPRAQWRTLGSRPWPGNVRELRNFIEAALALGHLPPVGDRSRLFPADPVASVLGAPYKEARDRVVDDFELRWLKHLLARTNGNVAAAAREGSINRSHLFELIKKHGLKAKD